MTILGDRIRMAREDADLSQAELATSLGQFDERLARTDAARISGWERGATVRVPFHAIVAIAQATNKPIDFFASAGDS